jgi:tetratricopeptide (TPR) repeat protein
MVSQGAKMTQVIGLSQVTVTYHRPGVKGRQIWGGLIPYNEVWRVGANEPTLVTFSDPVTINGQKLSAGTYRLLAIPGQSEWTVIFNAETKNWGSIYDAKYDSLKVVVKPEPSQHEEWLSFSFTDLTPSAAKMVIAWEKLKVGVTVEFNTLAKMESQVGDWRILNQAARYAATEKVYAEQAMGWIDRSIALDRNAANVRTKAELLAGQGKYKEAITLAEESMKLARAQNPAANVTATEQLINEWKKK